MDLRDVLGEEGGEHPEAGTDLEHDVVRGQGREPSDHPEDVLVDQEMLAELLLRGRSAHASENADAAFSSSCRARVAGSSPRTSASTATVWTTFAGSFGRPRRGCGLR